MSESDADAAVAEAGFADETVHKHGASSARRALRASQHVVHLSLVVTVQQQPHRAVSLRHHVVRRELHCTHTRASRR